MRLYHSLLAALFTLAPVAHAAWTPPANPNPSAILNEAQADTRANRYEDAFAKLTWFHENALRYDQGQTGVRLSFALSAFDELAKSYPAAKDKMIAYRDAAEKQLLIPEAGDKSANALDAYCLASPFMEFAAFNTHLKETSKTIELFKRLDREKPEIAAATFEAAKGDLLAAKEYKLCGKYMQGEASYQRILGMYHMQKGMTASNPAMKHLLDYADENFSNEVATLVAILVQNDRKPEAQKIAEKALKEKTDASFKALVDKSLAGNVPPKWP